MLLKFLHNICHLQEQLNTASSVLPIFAFNKVKQECLGKSLQIGYVMVLLRHNFPELSHNRLQVFKEILCSENRVNTSLIASTNIAVRFGLLL